MPPQFAAFMPFLAVALLVLNGSATWVGEHRNRWSTVAVLVAILGFFAGVGLIQIRNQLG